ncbi:MAG: hypothetical protein SFZ23_11385 [Planctomycetota bacterium]|nr:hypothetical protein [Planctomycetota bacterium]
MAPPVSAQSSSDTPPPARAGGPAHPPTSPSYRPVRRAKPWTVIIGIAGLAYAGLQTIGSLYYMGAPLLANLGQTAPVQIQGANTQVNMGAFGPGAAWYAFAVGLVSFVACGLGIYAFILMLRRKPGCRPLLVWWGVLSILIGIVSAAVLTLSQFEQMERIIASTPSPNPPSPALQRRIVLGSAGFAGLTSFFWNVSMPLVALVWTSLASTRRTLEQWRRPPAHPHYSG